jgi:hypothetical protein
MQTESFRLQAQVCNASLDALKQQSGPEFCDEVGVTFGLPSSFYEFLQTEC